MDSNLVSADMYFLAENQGYKCSLKIRYGVPPEKPLVGKICKDYLEMFNTKNRGEIFEDL